MVQGPLKDPIAARRRSYNFAHKSLIHSRSFEHHSFGVKFSQYFLWSRQKPDRAVIRIEWIRHVVTSSEARQIQPDGRIRLWARIPEMGNRYLRVVLLPDNETVHNAFFDRRFKP